MRSSCQQEITVCVYFSAADESIHYPNKKNKHYPFYSLASLLNHYTLENASQFKMGFSGTGLTETIWEAIYNWRGILFGTGIEEQCREAHEKVMQLLMRGAKVKVICFGTSRGGIAALRLAQMLGAIDANVLKVFLILIDPVPGNFFITTKLDFLSRTFTKKLRDLRHCKNIKEILSFYTNQPLPHQYVHAPLIPAFPKKSKITQEVIPGYHTEIQTSRPSKGCDILLIAQDDDSPSNRATLQRYEKNAKATNTPLILRKNRVFKMFGIAPNRTDWCWTTLSNTDGLLDELPFSNGNLCRDDDLFTTDLIEILKSAHARIIDINITTTCENKYITLANVLSTLASWGVHFKSDFNIEFNKIVIHCNDIHTNRQNISIFHNPGITTYNRIDYTLLLAYENAKKTLVHELSPSTSKNPQTRNMLRKECHSFPNTKIIITCPENANFLNATHEKLHKKYHPVEYKQPSTPMLHISTNNQNQTSDHEKHKLKHFDSGTAQQLLNTFLDEIQKTMTDQSKHGKKGFILTSYSRELTVNSTITTEQDLTNALRNIIALVLQRDRNHFSFFSTTTSGYAALKILQKACYQIFQEMIFGNADPSTLRYRTLRKFVYGENHKADFFMRNRFLTYDICEKISGINAVSADHYTNFLSRSRYSK